MQMAFTMSWLLWRTANDHFFFRGLGAEVRTCRAASSGVGSIQIARLSLLRSLIGRRSEAEEHFHLTAAE